MKIGERRSWLLLVLLFSVQLWAIPKPDRTNLPLPSKLDESDKDLLYEALQLQVYQDSEDPNQYYYMPPLHFKQYVEGAGSMNLNKHNVDHYGQAQIALSNLDSYRLEYTIQRLAELKNDIEKAENKIKEAKKAVAAARKDLESARSKGDEESIAFYTEWLQEETNSYEAAKKDLQNIQTELNHAKSLAENNQHLLPPGMGRSYFDMAIRHISLMGAKMAISTGGKLEEVERAINDKMTELGGGDGGYISANVYGGFTQSQRKALAAYRAKFLPNVKISLLPLEKLSFVPLSEWQKDPKRTDTDLTTMFANIGGSGDYLGLAITMNITISGSTGLAANLGPFIPPMGVKATFKEKLNPVKASLNCDFSNGYEVKGRTDIRDGAIIFDNDITKILKDEDHSNGACNLKVESGDINAAHLKAVEELERFFESMRITRTTLAKDEKEAYLKKVEADIENNRHTGGSRYEGIFHGIPGLGTLAGFIVPVLTKASDFYWHTNIQDVKKLSTVKFTKEIDIKGHQTVERDLPTSLCLIYNQSTNTYDRCTSFEEQDALTMPQAAAKAKDSPTCKEATGPYKCGELRDKAGETANRKITPATKDDEVPLNIE